MSDGLLVRLKPAGPWRFGSDSGARDETAELYHSDSVYSAVTSAMETLGELEAWLDATARSADPAVRFSSCFPWQGGSLFVLPPRPLWPPVSPANPILRNAHFLPLSLVHQLLNRKPLDEDAWSVDPYSRCLVPSARDASQAGPFRPVLRLRAAVDRPSRLSHGAHHAAGVEFAPDAGLWLALTFAGESSQSRWRGPVEAAIRLLADSGFGGQRSQGWGRSESPEFETAGIGRVLLPAQPAGVAPPPTDAPEENPAVPSQSAVHLFDLGRIEIADDMPLDLLFGREFTSHLERLGQDREADDVFEDLETVLRRNQE